MPDVDVPPIPVTTDALAALDPDDYPDGIQFTITDDGNRLYETRGADGARTLVPLGRPGIPAGGDVGQLLTKRSATDYDAGWKTVPVSLVPVANGDPDNPAYLFTPDGSGLYIEWP